MFWRVSDEEKENIFREKITSNIKEVIKSQEWIGSLQQQVDELSSGVNVQELEKHYKSLKAEKKRLGHITKQYEQQVLYWRKRLSRQRDLEEKCRSIKQEVETLQENEHRWKQEIGEMKSKERDPIEMEDELEQLKNKKKTLTQENKALQKDAENLRKKVPRQERTEQLCKIEQNKKQYQNVETQPGCSHWDMPKIKAENKRNLSKSSETLSLITKASDRERELLQQTSTLREQLAVVKADLKCLQANSSLKESYLLKENEGLKKQVEDTQQELKLGSDTLTKTVCNYKKKLTTLKSQLAVMTTQLENEQQTRVTLESEIMSLRTCSIQTYAGFERTEQLCEIEQNKKQYQNVETQPGCSHWDMPKIKAENKRNLSKSSETLSLITKASDRERELLQQTSTLQEQLAVVKADLKYLQANSSLKESYLLKENEGLKKQLADTQQDLKLESDTLTKAVCNYKKKLTTLKSQLAVMTTRLENEQQTRVTLESEIMSLQTRLDGAVNEAKLWLEAHTERERAPLENEVHQLTLQLREKWSLLEALQRENDRAGVTIKKLEISVLAEREQVSCARASEKAAQEQLVQLQRERMSLLQQLEEAKNQGAAKEQALMNAEERYRREMFILHTHFEERKQLMEDKSKELNRMIPGLKDQIYKLEREKAEREASIRQLQQELADSLRKLSMSEASLEVCTRRSNKLEQEMNGNLERLNRKFDNFKSVLEEKQKEVGQWKCENNEANSSFSTLEHYRASASVSQVASASSEDLDPLVQIREELKEILYRRYRV